MTSKYAVEFEIPDELPELLKDLSREILRAVTYEQISGTEGEIYAFAAKHFKKLARQTRSMRLSRKKMKKAAMDLFRKADEDESGDLNAEEVRQIFQSLAADLGLSSDDQVKNITSAVMREADISGDGLLNYEEFLPVALDIIESLFHKYKREKTDCEEPVAESKSTMFSVLEKRQAMKAARMKAEGALVNGMSKEELDKLMLDIFHKADTNGNGILEPEEFRTSLRDSSLKFADEDIEFLLKTVKKNEEGNISFKDFVPLCYDLLVEQLAQHYVDDEDAKNQSVIYRRRAERILGDLGPKEVESQLMAMFQRADADNNGFVDATELISAIESMNLGFTTTDIAGILQSATTGNGAVHLDYREFAPLAFDLLMEQLKKRIEIDDEIRAEAQERIFGGVSQEKVEAMFESVFDAADVNKDGTLSTDEMRACLKSSQIEFTEEDLRRIIRIADMNGDGKIQLEEFLPVCYELTLEVAMEQISSEKGGR